MRYLEIAEAIKAEAGVRLHSVCDTLSSRCWAGVRVIEAPAGADPPSALYLG